MCCKYTLMDSFVKPCSFILSGIGCHGISIGDAGCFNKTVQTVCGSKSGNKGNSELIDDKLNNDTANGNNDILQGHGCSQRQQFFAQIRFQAEIFPGKTDKINAKQAVHGIYGCNKLRNDGSSHGTGHTPVKRTYKQKIQSDVDDRCQNHGTKRSLAVAQRTEIAGSVIISHHNGAGCIINTKI